MKSLLSDEKIVSRIKKGDTVMFSLIVKRYSKILLNYIYRLSGNNEDSEDILQELFIRIYNNINKFDCSRKFKPWVYRIATNICYDFSKKKNKNKTISLDKNYSEKDKNKNSLLDTIGDDNFSPEKMAVSKELIDTVQLEINKLPIKQKEVFILFHFEKMSYKEISTTIKAPLGTIKSRLHNACQKIYLNISAEGL